MSIFTIPCDFHTETLDDIIQYNENHSLKIQEIYGSYSNSGYGSGRKSTILPDVSDKAFEKYILECGKRKIEFNYTFNSTCIGNKEFYSDSKRELLYFFDYLKELGITNYTVAMPSILNILEHRYQDVNVTLSVITGIDTMQKLKHYCTYDVIKNIYIHEKILRNFDLVKKMIDYAARFDKKICVIINSICLAECPYRMFHYNYGSQVLSGMENPIELYGTLCASDKIRNPRNILTAHWIRPEDISLYKELGIAKFKVAGRELKGNTAEKLIEMCKIYDNGEYDGNLLYFFTGFADCSYSEVIDMRSTEKLNTYLKLVYEGKLDCSSGECSDCGACSEVLKEIKVNEEARSKWLHIFKDRIDVQGE